MDRVGPLWAAFKNVAIVFSFIVTFALVMVLLLLVVVGWYVSPDVADLRGGTLCPLVADVNRLVTDLDNAVIERTITISQALPVAFQLPVEQNTNVVLTGAVTLQRPTTFTFPAGGGQINGTVAMSLPRGQQLPVHLVMTVPVSTSLPVHMDVPVTIPLKETDLGPVVGRLKELLFPWTARLGKALRCSAP